MKRHGAHKDGFTLVELLVGVVLFTGVIASLFSVIVALRKAEAFRDDNVAVTQAASYAYEPIVRAIKAADAVEGIRVDGECVQVRGFYGLGDDNQPVLSANLDAATSSSQVTLVTIDAEHTHDATIGPKQQWVRRDYSLKAATGAGGASYTTIHEATYHASVDYEWPAPMTDCERSHWVLTGERELTGPQVSVQDLFTRFAAPRVASDGADLVNAPFVTVGVTVTHPTSTIAPPMSLQTTITPTFTYGEQRD